MGVMADKAIKVRRLPDPPAEYDPKYMRQLISQLEQFMASAHARGRFEGETLNLNRLPTTSTDLGAGEVWNDAGDLKIV